MCAVQTTLAQTNVLRIGSVTSPAGKTAVIPIELDNASDIIGVQFDIDVPYDLAISESSVGDGSPVATLSATRCGDHQVECYQTSTTHWRNPSEHGGVSYYKTYRFMLYSPQNSRIQGSTGIILTLEMPLPEDLPNGTVFPLYLIENSVVLTNRDKQNLVTGQQNGQVTIETVPRPDLLPTAVSVKQTLADPGDVLDFSWTVTNVGDKATGAGWSERLYLENENTGKRTYLGTAAYDAVLAPGAAVERTSSFALSDYPGISGQCRPVVVLTPAAGCGEIALAQENNTAIGKTTLRVNKHLVLTAHKNPIPEGSTSGYYCELRRTGDTSESQVFGITSSTADGRTDRLTFSASGMVRFDAGSDRAGFYAYPVDDEVFTGDERVAVIVNKDLNNGYGEVVDSVLIEENDEIGLTLTTDRSDYNEGDTIRLTVRVPQRFFSGPLPVYLTIEQPARFKLPQRAVIADGETEATVLIPVVQDKVPSNDISVKITGTADHHKKGEVLFILHDDDVPAINFSLSTHVVSEGAGASALMGTITRSEVTNNKITVNLTADSYDVYFPSTGNSITLQPGTTTVNFPIGVKDNMDNDGDRLVHITASVYISDCSCTVVGKKQASVTDSLLITDNDGSTLSMTTSRGTVVEGDTQPAVITVTRNSNTAAALAVSIECDAADVTFPSEVTIPAGQKSVTFEFSVPANDTEEGDRTVSLTARAAGFNTGSCWMLITDRNLPDGIISSLSLSKEQASPGDAVQATIVVENQGMGTLPTGTIVRLTFGNDMWLDYTLPEATPRGEKRTFDIQLKAPVWTGTREVKAIIDPTGQLSELLTTNNESEPLQFTVLSAFTYTIESDKSVYRAEEYAVFSGRITPAEGSTADPGGQRVEVWYNNADREFVITTTTKADGTFSVKSESRIGPKGDVTFGVCLVGENNRDVLGQLSVAGVELSYGSLWNQQLIINQDYPYTIRVHNPSSYDLHNVRIITTTDPAISSEISESYSVVADEISLLPGKGWAEMKYTVRNDGSDKSVLDHNYGLVLAVTSDEGIPEKFWLQCFARKPQPALIALETNINVSVSKGKTVLYPLVLVNQGYGETGVVEITTPSVLENYLTLASPAKMSSMQPGDTAVVMLRFSGQYENAPIGVKQFGRMAVNCDFGYGINVDFSVKVVDDSRGNLRVRVQDENTIYGNKDGEHPYVSDATVQLIDYNTGAILQRGTSNSDGECLFSDMEVGYYKLYVTAAKHDTYEQTVFINADQTTDHLATISYQAISVTWDVVETEVEDQYDIVTTVTYETQVPVPVVRVTQPDSLFIYELDPGKSVLYNIVLRNEGLITAQETEVTLPEVEGFVFTPLAEISGLDLAAEQSMVIPVRVTRLEGTEFSDSVAAARFRSEGITRRCKATTAVKWKWPCGAGSGKTAWLNTAMNLIPLGDTGGLCYNGMYIGGGNENGFGGYGGGWDTGGKTTTSGTNLDAYITKAFCIALVWLPDPDLGLGDYFDLTVNYVDKLLNVETNTSTSEILFQITKATTELGLDIAAATPKIAKKVPLIGTAIKIGLSLQYMLGDNADYKMLSRRGMPSLAATRPRRTGLLDDDPNYDSPLLTQYADKLGIYYKYLSSIIKIYGEVMGAQEVLDNITPEFANAFNAWNDILSESIQGTAESINEWYTMPQPPVDYFKVVFAGIWACDTTQIPRQYIVDSTPQTHWSNPYVGMMPGGSATYYDYSMAYYLQRLKGTYIHCEPIARFYNQLAEKSPQDIDYSNMIHMDSIRYYINELNEAQNELIQRGFTSWQALVESANKDARDWLDGPSASSCAKVKLELDQTMVMTRQAFRGTLTIENETDQDITDIDLRVLVYNKETGEQATSHEMQVSIESIDRFEGTLEGPWTLGPRSKGVATVLFIPTKYAAPDHAVTYQFGGNLYFNNSDGEHVEALRYVPLDVKPAPELDLTYFLQRDVYGDNPLTQTIVEPIVPAEFTVLINNKGKGDATNIRMTTHQPKIIENEKGLLIDFNIESSTLGYEEKTMALDSLIATEFGDIKAGGHQFATWWLTASLLGHFSEYNVQATHVTSYGNPDLSLLDQVTIHELVRSVDYPYEDYYDNEGKHHLACYFDAIGSKLPMRCWLVNDEGDTNPDHVYLADGFVTDKVENITPQIQPVEGESVWMVGPLIYKEASNILHINIADPSQGRGKVKSIQWTDDTGTLISNLFISPNNYWQTEYLLQNGFDPIRDPRLHIVTQTKRQGYLRVEFEPLPEVPLTVTSIETVPGKDEIAEEVIDQLTVTFSKPVKAETFDRSDLVLRREGKPLDSGITITKSVESDSIFTLKMQDVDVNGYYVLQVKPDGIQGQDGFWGEEGLQVKWMLFRDGLVQYNVEPWPSAMVGNVTTSNGGATNGDVEYGSDITMTATPSEGYDFSYWGTVDSDVETVAQARARRGSSQSTVHSSQLKDPAASTLLESQINFYSDEATVVVPMNQVYNMRAVFKPKKYSINVDYVKTMGSVKVGTGETSTAAIYDYGTVLQFTAQPASDDYLFEGYYNGDELLSSEPTYGHIVTGNVTITARFRPAVENVTLREGVDYTPADVASAYVRLQSSFVKDEWNTIVLPCAVSDPESVFGIGTRVARLKGISGGVVQFESVTAMEANVPYIIWVGSLSNNGLIGSRTSHLTVYNVGNTALVKASPVFSQQGVTMTGNYAAAPVEANSQNSLFTANTINVVETAAQSGRFKAWFALPAAAVSLSETSLPLPLLVTVDGKYLTDLRGDVNTDGLVNTEDVARATQGIAIPETEGITIPDMNRDGRIDIADLFAIIAIMAR